MTMRFCAPVAFFCFAPLLMALATPSEQKETAVAEEPRYEASSSVDLMMVVSEVRTVAAGSVLPGMHLIMRPESSKANGETTDVYLGPDDYMKDFGCHFVKGDRLEVKGSKVKWNGASAILAREVRQDSNTVYLRDEHGVPYWAKS